MLLPLLLRLDVNSHIMDCIVAILGCSYSAEARCIDPPNQSPDRDTAKPLGRTKRLHSNYLRMQLPSRRLGKQDISILVYCAIL
jgi:hypothetical protein